MNFYLKFFKYQIITLRGEFGKGGKEGRREERDFRGSLEGMRRVSFRLGCIFIVILKTFCKR